MEKPPPFALQLSLLLQLIILVMADGTKRFGGDYGANVLGGGPNVGLKNEWPEVVGLAADEAEKKIKEDMPAARIQIVQPDHFMTMDFNTSRVRIHVDSSAKVSRPPRVG